MGTTAIKAIKNEVALVQIANLYDDDIDGLNAGFTISETPAVDTDGVVDGNFISDVLLNNDGSDILRELSLRARARAAIWTDVAVKLDEEAAK